MSTTTEIVVSGIRATGKLHLGNYLGVLQRFASMSQNPQYECFFFVADLHTLTTLQDGRLIQEHLPNIVLDYLAAGIDPHRAHLYVQSDVSAVTELAWYLSCLTTVNDLQGLPTYKDKAGRVESPNAGLLSYPVLMAADIIGPRAQFVPVGRDQKPHLELTQKIARALNRYCDDFFPIPDALVEEMVLVPGLSSMSERGDFPKMGKSDENTINLSDTPEDTWQKIRVSPTDPARQFRSDPGTPEHCAIYALHSQVSEAERIQAVHEGCRSAGIGCIDCKGWLAESVNNTLAEFRERRSMLAQSPSTVKDVLAAGRAAVTPRFEETLALVRERLGIGERRLEHICHVSGL